MAEQEQGTKDMRAAIAAVLTDFVAEFAVYMVARQDTASDDELKSGLGELIGLAADRVLNIVQPQGAEAASAEPVQRVSSGKEAQIENAFTYHAPKPGQPSRYNLLRDRAREFALLIAELTPASREQSLALTNLEQAVMWANAAIARNE